VLQAIRLADSRKVALKIIRSDRLADSRARARFAQEHETLARLEHPGIVRVLEHGELPSGEVWFAAEYVAGVALDRHVDGLDRQRRRQAGDMAAAAFPVDEALRLFVQVCEAVQAAHRAGVIHRDLKPSNILVDADGRPHILDFGVARPPTVSDPALVTLTGEYLGSPAWSSPEQVEGQPAHVDTRTDVYSLGVVFYRVLTGTFPYEVDGPLSRVFDQIRQADPTPPRAHVTFIDDELQAILLKALAKEREGRYQSVSELREDLERYLAGQPVQAKGRSRAYALRKFVRRHKMLTATVATLVMLSVVYATTMTVLYRRAVLAEHQAERNATHARDAAELILTELDGKLKDVAGTQELRLELLGSAYQTVNALREQYGDDLRLDADYARTLTKLSDIAAVLGRLDEALRDREAALAVYTELAEQEPDDPDRQVHVSIGHVLVGDVHKGLGNLAEAQRRYEIALRLDERLVEAYPGNDHYLDNLSWSYERLGYLARQRHDLDQARAYYLARHELATQLAERHPDNLDRQFGLHLSLSLLADMNGRCGEDEQAEACRQQAWPIIEELVARAPDNSRFLARLATAFGGRGFRLSCTGHIEEAAAAQEEQAAILRRLVAMEPAVGSHRVSLGAALTQLAGSRAELGDQHGSHRYLEEARALLEEATAEQPYELDAWTLLLTTYSQQAANYSRGGQLESAEAAARRALEVGQALAARPDARAQDLAACAELLLHIHPAHLRDPEQAVIIARRAVERSGGVDPARLELLAAALDACGRRDDAIAALEQAVAIGGNAHVQARCTHALTRLRQSPR